MTAPSRAFALQPKTTAIVLDPGITLLDRIDPLQSVLAHAVPGPAPADLFDPIVDRLVGDAWSDHSTGDRPARGGAAA